MESGKRLAVIVGGGPAGLTAAYELLNRTDYRPEILEATNSWGGLSRTLDCGGNRLDIGPHRFFSKSDRVMAWWDSILPVEDPLIDPSSGDVARKAGSGRLMRIRRQTRIYYRGRLFNYPVRFDPETVLRLGILRCAWAGLSYLKALLLPLRPEENLEQFFINRFGKALYGMFFRDYTEKVWGIPCSEIPAAWGAQRVKGLSIKVALKHFFTGGGRLRDPGTPETSLIEEFLYPTWGAGEMWEEVASQIARMGGTIRAGHRLAGVVTSGDQVTEVAVEQVETGEVRSMNPELLFSTIPVRELIGMMKPDPPARVRRVAEGLQYRDLVVVGVLVDAANFFRTWGGGGSQDMPRDNWIYMQDPSVKMGRLQIYNNWGPNMVKRRETVWLGAEYFCNESDEVWAMSDEDLAELALEELARVGFVEKAQALDSCVIRERKAYPAYFGTYSEFDLVQHYLDGFSNLYLIGRNGMHRYNNQDHSMLSAMVAVDNLVAGVQGREEVWAVNTESDYQEEPSA